VKSTNALGHVTQYGYDNANRVTSTTAPNGVVTSYTWDARDRLLTFKGLVAEPGPHQGFLGMARYMAAEGQAALAVLFAGAALDEALRLAYLEHVKPPDMAALREAGRVTDALLDAGVLDAAAGTRVRAWLALVADALQEPAPALDPAAAAAMAEGVAAFAARR